MSGLEHGLLLGWCGGQSFPGVSAWERRLRQASLSITNSWSSFKLMSIESVMPSNHLIWASLELSPSVESCGCGLGPSPVRLG